MIGLTRRYRFSASHRLHSSELSEVENTRVYGKCNNPFGHGHDYVLEITVGGQVDPLTGLIVSVQALDGFVERHVLRLFANRNLNLDVPQFTALVPTTENIALVIADLIQRHWPDCFGSMPAAVRRVHIQETDRNGFEILLDVSGNQAPVSTERESVTVHG
jgi:6-pyruvoyltetrahydropterin/6-carboxytetrahydropterin synthase